uniref:siderophore ABC transporter substrate-binding protein n=1 Tax=Candidatus Enterococcus willemsii TaxID=1857215 RepID=UPI00403F3B45
MKKFISGFIMLAATLTLAACGGNDTASTDSTTASSTATPKEVTVKDSNGDEITVPYNPSKVVVFDNSALDTMDALGVGDAVIGAATDSMPDYLADYKEVESAGGIKEPDLEKINQLQPDLIIISGRQLDFEKDLSAIAPTIFLSVDGKDTWNSIQTNVKLLAEIFGKQEEAATQLADLGQSIDEVKAKAADSGEKALTLLVNEGSLSAYGLGSRFGIIHDAFGFAQADENIEVSTHGQNVSYEYVLEKNPDVIFVVDRTKAIGGDDSKNNLAANDLVKETNAGKNDKVIELDPQVWYLSGSGLESVKIMLDDVKKALD